MQHLCKMHPKLVPELVPFWMRMAFRAATECGISFGIFDLQECCVDCSKVRPHDLPKRGKATNDCISKRVTKSLQRIVDRNDVAAPGFTCAAMALSGARGKKQVRQLVGARGYLSPGHTDWPKKHSKFYFNKPLLKGMDKATAFWAAMNGRASMVEKKRGPASAGGLTRSLVFALWPWRVREGDCGYTGPKQRGPGVCLYGTEMAVCQECYGELPDGHKVSVDYRAGLIAAQSIGERGTQLSMQAFHTGEQVVSINDVRNILTNQKYFSAASSLPRFKKRMVKMEAYKHIDLRHLELLWRVIHEAKEKADRTLRGVIRVRTAKDLFIGLGQDGQREYIYDCIKSNRSSEPHSAIAKILLGQWNDLSDDWDPDYCV